MMPLQVIRKHRKTIIVLLIILIAILSYIPIPRKWDITYTGIRFNDMDDETEIVEVTIKGKYKNYILNLFKRDRFEGSIVVSDDEVTKNGKLLPVEFLNYEYHTSGGLTYSYENKFVFGYIAFDDIFEAILIIGLSDSEEGKDYKIVAPAKDRETAIRIEQEIYFLPYPTENNQ